MGKKRKVAVLSALKPKKDTLNTGGKKSKAPEIAQKPSAVMSKQKQLNEQSENEGQVLISKFHTLQKQLNLAQDQGDEKQATTLQQEMAKLGGLSAYQTASLKGESKGGFNASTWVLEFLVANHTQLNLPSIVKLLDVGAIVEHYPSPDPRTEGLPSRLQVTSIDINPLSPGVLKADFFDYASTLLESSGGGKGSKSFSSSRKSFDIIVLSLVVNFVGDPWKRGLMITLASHLLTPGGLLFLVLPSACVLNSRFVNEPLLTRIATALGLAVMEMPSAVRTTASLWMCAYVRVGPPQDPLPSTLRKRNEIRVGPGNFNNFAILLGQRQSLPATGQAPEVEGTKVPRTSNQRKKARKKKYLANPKP